MDRFVDVFVGVLIGVALLTLILNIFSEHTDFYANGYKQGQVDAITGKIKYSLVKQDDNTLVWEEIKGEK